VVVAFALIGGEDLNELETGAANAQIRYDAAFPTITAVNQAQSQSPSFDIYPNPAQGNVIFNINLATSDKVKISVYDVNGKLVKQIHHKLTSGMNNVQVSIEDLPAGLYNCELTGNNLILNKKLSVIK
jgi:hypothetical protein